MKERNSGLRNKSSKAKRIGLFKELLQLCCSL
ncbi:hypothetical protein LINGRAHAP2_LOCUS24019 [Linum grandiflorum]